MALVELYRTTGERDISTPPPQFIERRGHGLLGSDRFGAAYWQDHAPVRDAPTVAGHAVRQLYLDCGAVDVATEVGDAALLDAVVRRWHDMVATRTYLTGGVGSRHRDESFGDPYELPPDQAYAESCAAIASVMLAWRLLLATGEPACADVIERTVLNGVLPAIDLAGTSFFYVNPLQRRTVRAAADPGTGERGPWYPCACCPPNIMRTLSSWEQLVATTDGDRHPDPAVRRRHGHRAGRRWRSPAPRCRLTNPGTVGSASRSRRVPPSPGRCRSVGPDGRTALELTWPADSAGPGEAARGEAARTATWRAGDRVELDMPMTPRITRPHPRIDAVRGAVAIERGPLVYCLETADLPAEAVLEDIRLALEPAPTSEPRSDLSDGFIGVVAHGSDRGPGPETPVAIRAIPYLAWSNRGTDGMRVWIPAADPGDAGA